MPRLPMPRMRPVPVVAVAVVATLLGGLGAVSTRPGQPAAVAAPVTAPTADPAAPTSAPGPTSAPLVSPAPTTVPVPPVVAHPSRAASAASSPSRPARRTPRPRRVAPAAKSCAPAPRIPSTPAVAARAVGERLEVFAAPWHTKPQRVLSNPRERDGFPLDLLVRERRGDWVRVQYSERPNGSTGWVRANALSMSTRSYHVLVELCAHRLTLLDHGVPVFSAPVAVGKASSPTPTGGYYVDFIAPMKMSSGYGPWMVSVAAFSDVYQTFGGGVGQIAIHGTNASGSIGKDASHGCVRMRPADVTRLKDYAVVGTPVTIVA